MDSGKPRAFRDAEDRLWGVTVTVGSLKRVKTLTGEDVGRMSVPDLAGLVADPLRFVDVLYALCKPAADAHGLTDGQFAEGLRGDAIEAAAEAFWGAVADFFPSRGRGVMLALAERGRAEAERSTAEVMAMLTGTGAPPTSSPTTPSPSASSSPGSSGATPTPGASAS